MTPGRRSSVCIQTRSGPGRATVSASFGPYSVRSSASSLSAPTASQVSAIALARVTTEATAPALIPRLRAVSR